MSKSFTDYLRLNQQERHRLLARLDQRMSRESELCQRRHTRYEYRALDIAMSVVHPGGGQSRVLVSSRNLSAGGISFLHGGFLYVGSECKLVLMCRDGSPILLAGHVRHCRHVQGSCHEVGVQFDREIDPQTILLPSDLSEAEDGPRTIGSVRIPTLRGRVLIADEALSDRRLLAHQLSATGLMLVSVATSGAALDAVKKDSFGAFICGLDLQGGTGEYAIQSMRELGYTGPILVLTSVVDPEILSRVMKAGATEVAGKPYDPLYVMYMLAEWLKLPKPRGPIASRFEGEPGMGELLQSYVQEAKLLAGRLERALDDDDLNLVRELCTRMAGSGSNHGFDQLSVAARDALRNLEVSGRIDAARAPLRRLASICHRLACGSQDPGAASPDDR